MNKTLRFRKALQYNRTIKNRKNNVILIEPIVLETTDFEEPRIKINDIKLLCDYFNENHSKELSSCTPPSLSAAIVNYYIITNNLDIDKNTISESSGVSVVTIQKITNILISII